jgi:hypothetical protein
MALARIACGYVDDITGLPCTRVAIQIVYEEKQEGYEKTKVPSCGVGGGVHDHGSSVVWVF